MRELKRAQQRLQAFEGTGLLESLIDGLVRWILRRYVLDADLF